MKLINNRYKLINMLEKDVFGTTYIASDLSNENKKMLLKLIYIKNKDKKFIDFLIHNFIRIASLKHVYLQQSNSFNIINTIDTKKVDDFQYFYTSEYVEEKFDNYQDLPRLEINNIFLKLCYALNYLHFRGIAYKYLNFENIVTVNNEGNVEYKLRDLVTIYQYQENISSINQYNNQFIAPEIKSGKNGDYSSDIYSLGVILFYIFSGLDYKKSDFNEVLKKSNGNNGLTRILEKMTAPDPSSRYKNILKVVNDLKEYLAVEYDFFDRNCYEKLYFNIPLVSRLQEKSIVIDSINGKFLGKLEDNFIFVYGEAGIGKSRFVKEIDFQVRMNKINVCSIEVSQENEQMFYIYKMILKFIVKHNKIDNDLIDKYGNELVKILPGLTSMWNVKPSETLMEDKEILRLNNRIYNFISEFASKNPLVIILDNIHYVHQNDLNILEHLIKNTKNSSLVIICTYRHESSLKFSGFLSKLKENKKTRFIQLRKLNFEETAIMIKDILGMNYKPLRLTTKIMEETNGNPRYVEEIVKSLFVNGQILINEERLWFVDIDDIYDLELPSSIDDAILKSIHSLDSITRDVLDVISIFHFPVSLQTISKISDKDEASIIKVLVNLVCLRIINEKFEDWGYSYDYYDKHIKSFIYNNIGDNQKRCYHLNAAKILEDFYIREGRDYALELIYHFTNCGENDKAIKYCIKSAEKMEELYIYNQAIVFYNKAIDLLTDYDNLSAFIDILMRMGHIYELIGEVDNAFEVYSKVANISHEKQLPKHLIDAQNKLAHIYFFKNETDLAKNLLEESIALSKSLGYIGGELEGALQQCKLFNFTKTYPNLRALLNKYINISLKDCEYCYTGQFFNEKGKLYFDEGEMSKSKYCFEQSIFFLEKSNNNIKTTSSLNNMGVIYLEAYKNIPKAREYYNQALDLFKKYNYITDRGVVLLNIGETYLYEDKYSEAINYFNKAVDISTEIGDSSILFASYVHLCHTYLSLYQYGKSYFYLKKLELEFENYSRYDYYYYCYYLIHINFYVQLHNYCLADNWYEDFFNAISNKRVDFDLELRIIELKMYKIQAQFHLNKSIDIEGIKAFLSENLDKVHLKPVRDFLINLVYILTVKNQMDFAKYFLDVDAKLIDKFNTEIFDLKRDFALGLFSDNKIEFFKKLLNRLEGKELHEFEWKIFKILGDEYYKRNDCFNALSNYITSLDILKSLAHRIPENLRQNYIFGYDIHLVIKERIEDLKGKIFGRDYVSNFKIANIKLKKNLKEFFDFSDLNTFFSNKEFMKSVYKASRQESPLQITDLKALIQNLIKNELYNIQLILGYCIQICLAERGFVFIINENNDIQEVISIGNHEPTKEIRDFLKNVHHKGHDVLITNENQFNNKSLKHNEIKSLICIPIKNLDKENPLDINTDYKKKCENKIYSGEIVGYLYLDTKRVFNNITYESYEKCCSLVNLLYVMIQNYDLKKISSIDKLTNLFLRKHIEDLFKKEMFFAQKNELQLSVVMCDIDKFKQVNDFYGHRKGDEVLGAIGNIIKSNLRKTDLVGRYGGEEFIIILPETDVNDAYIACEKLRGIIENSEILGRGRALTMSFGISCYPIHGSSEEELVEKADQALYKSKKSGRNKTTIWNKNIGYDKYRYDKLAGIITGNTFTDYRNVKFILDIIELLKSSIDRTDRIFKVLGYLIEISESEYGAIFEIEDETIKDIYARKRADNKWVENFKFNRSIISEFIGKKQGDFFIDWNDISEIDTFTGTPSWNSFIIVPLINNDVQKGILLLSIPINDKEFDFGTFNLVNSLSGAIGSVI
ncbi:MAG: diguanylate cyclase [Clostridia bacterium]|nr:diguanylate cyclase [Clostridia bacterium]